KYVWRTDRRSPSQLKFSRGFQTKSTSNGMLEDLSLWRHCKGAPDGSSMDNDGFVSTTWSYAVAQGWVGKFHQGNAFIYKIATDESLIDVQATLKVYNPYPEEKEFAGIQEIHWDQVQGWHKWVNGVELAYEYNLDFDQAEFGGHPHGGSQFPLAGFPRNHPAWSQLPWSRYAMC
ncbi:ADP-ribosylation, partial [Bimuria novae-zelandiae CBS 107.79]